MSARGFFGFRINGQDKITYNHGDSYPEYLGDAVVEWVRAAFSPTRYEATKAAVRALEVVDDPEAIASSQHIQKVGMSYLEMSVGGGNGTKDTDITYYRLLRGAHPSEGIEHVLAAGVMIRFEDPDVDYGYLVDINYETVEFYDWYTNRPSKLGSRYRSMILRGIYPISEINTWRKVWMMECWPSRYENREER